MFTVARDAATLSFPALSVATRAATSIVTVPVTPICSRWCEGYPIPPRTIHTGFPITRLRRTPNSKITHHKIRHRLTESQSSHQTYRSAVVGAVIVAVGAIVSI